MSLRNLEVLFSPRSVAVLGAPQTPGQQQMLAHLDRSAPRPRTAVGWRLTGWTHADDLAVPIDADLAVAFDGRLLHAEAFERLGERGCRALIWATDVPADAAALDRARRCGVRILGPRCAGVAVPRAEFNASAFETPLHAGRIALIVQSRTVAAAALDWAAGRGLGFSWLAVTGAEADVDLADLLDYAALDPQVGAVVLQLGRVADGRAFMSAARACSRAKPVVVLQTAPEPGHCEHDRDQRWRRLRSAAFARAGLVECESLPGLFDAIAALERLGRLDSDRVLVVGNGSGVCALGTDAVQRCALTLSGVGDQARRKLQARFAQVRVLPTAVDVGPAGAVELVELLRILAHEDAGRALLLLHSPGPGQAHAAAARAIAAGGFGAQVLTVWLGLATAQPARRICAAAAVPTFASPDAAAGALAALREYRRTQELLTQTPPLYAATRVARARLAGILQRAAAGELSARNTRALLQAYGIGAAARVPAGTPALEVEVSVHPEFGLYLALEAQGGALRGRTVYALPPLDGLLARRLLDSAGLSGQGASHWVRRLVSALLRLSDLLVEIDRLQYLRLRLAPVRGRDRCAVSGARIRLGQMTPPRRRLALAPYPSQLAHDFRARDGERIRVRPVRPQDEPAVVAMLSQTDPEAIRLRFFRVIRHFSHAMAARLTQIDYDRELVLVAEPAVGQPHAVVALAHLALEPDGRRAEYAILVHQSHAGRGLGTHLMRCLLDYAAGRGVEQVYGEVMAENTAMLSLCARLGFTVDSDPDDPSCLRVRIDPRRVARAAP
ncbi:MAG: bifunctional acetate--CoA ligase family protein/GNAT family N-acetyltransferase [Gammaproteobacteria bacterium]|nr:bifunctional acetate--CoA ligase family protein/GNAT family N-acetyltransferase [Gammaproteobacteria bacterium]